MAESGKDSSSSSGGSSQPSVDKVEKKGLIDKYLL